ncbi:MAG: SpoIID/LytB domain-containing protein [bacterium]|nr:SpoIID/LytB domain-containing protein [bacterium]MDZ4247810.1 SpoIID/LytB domain-containing protein [Patescibacteria group bacterium]
MKQNLRKTAFTVALCSLIGAGLAIPSASAQDSLEKARADKSLYQGQQQVLNERKLSSADDLRLAKKTLSKHRQVVAASEAKLEEVNERITRLKAERGSAMEEAYVTSGRENLLFALVDSTSLSEFLRRGQYTIFLVNRKEDLVTSLDGRIAGLDTERRDLVTAQNALEDDIRRLADQIALLELQLKANADNLADAAAREAYLSTVTGCSNRNHRDVTKQNGPVDGRFAFVGSGTDHGLGMSQFGARGAAKHGKNYKEILNHYYRGTRLDTTDAHAGYRGNLDRYVAGVVQGEMGQFTSERSAREALKAQAVAARSFAVATLNSGGQLDDTTGTQVYTSPRAAASRVANDTARQVLTYDGSVIPAYYHSTSGGWTENNENVWGGRPLPWLRGVASPLETDSPSWRWESRGSYSRSQMEDIMNSDPLTSVGRLETVRIAKRCVSGRVAVVEVRGSRGTKKVTGNEFRDIMYSAPASDESFWLSTLFGFR